MKRSYPSVPIPAVGVIVRAGDQILLVQRGTDPFKGDWTFPGGAIELGETAPQAARREAKEETGLDVEPDLVAAIVDNVVRDDEGRIAYHYVIIDYTATLVGGTLKPGSDVTDVRWVCRDDLDSLNITTKANQILRQLLADSAQEPGASERTAL